MSDIPKSVSPRSLFWLWYERLPLKHKQGACDEFQRFVAQAEEIAQLEQSASVSTTTVASDLFLKSRAGREEAKLLRAISQMLRVSSQLQRVKSQMLINKSQMLRAESRQHRQND
jgi:hypothetical protein